MRRICTYAEYIVYRSLAYCSDIWLTAVIFGSLQCHTYSVYCIYTLQSLSICTMLRVTEAQLDLHCCACGRSLAHYPCSLHIFIKVHKNMNIVCRSRNNIMLIYEVVDIYIYISLYIYIYIYIYIYS